MYVVVVELLRNFLPDYRHKVRRVKLERPLDEIEFPPTDEGALMF